MEDRCPKCGCFADVYTDPDEKTTLVCLGNCGHSEVITTAFRRTLEMLKQIVSEASPCS